MSTMSPITLDYLPPQPPLTNSHSHTKIPDPMGQLITPPNTHDHDHDHDHDIDVDVDIDPKLDDSDEITGTEDTDITDPDLDLDFDPTLDDDDSDDDTLAKIQGRISHLTELYTSGKKLFPRQLLADLDAQIDQGDEEVAIHDLDDVRHTYSLKIPGWCADMATSYRISYNSIQNLTCIHPSFPENALRDTPISICYMSSAEYPKASLEEVRRKFDASTAAWESSETCKALEAHLSSLAVRLTKPIHKIVGFGLGTLTALEDGFHAGRAHAQHAAVRSMVRVLMGVRQGRETKKKKKGVVNGDVTCEKGAEEQEQEQEEEEEGEGEIKCYAQDPAYTDVDAALLTSIGITPLDDPKGFLEIDEHTLVFSVSPNVPVKQIVADVQWPGAMVWNTVSLEEAEAQWEKQERDGEEFWVVPFTTDPDSERIRTMVQNYSCVSLRDSDEYFGDLSIYVR
ncbi:hypothetical protein BJX99DRAFT_241333 [Aspergillus californicus]